MSEDFKDYAKQIALADKYMSLNVPERYRMDCKKAGHVKCGNHGECGCLPYAISSKHFTYSDTSGNALPCPGWVIDWESIDRDSRSADRYTDSLYSSGGKC